VGHFPKWQGEKKTAIAVDGGREKAVHLMRFSLDLKSDFRLYFAIEIPRAASAGWFLPMEQKQPKRPCIQCGPSKRAQASSAANYPPHALSSALPVSHCWRSRNRAFNMRGEVCLADGSRQQIAIGSYQWAPKTITSALIGRLNEWQENLRVRAGAGLEVIDFSNAIV
jgi:ribosomal protein L37E